MDLVSFIQSLPLFVKTNDIYTRHYLLCSHKCFTENAPLVKFTASLSKNPHVLDFSPLFVQTASKMA